MATPGSNANSDRVRADGKFLRLGKRKFFIKGVTYGPFTPDAAGSTFASPEQTRRDFGLLQELGANTVRVYHTPPREFLDTALEFDLRVLVDIPWNHHLCFLDSDAEKRQAREAVREAVRACAGHPGVLGFSVANEIPPAVVRWSGSRAVAEFLDDLIDEGRQIDPESLFTFTNFPPTEYLQARNGDFLSFNLYLHQRRPFENYLARLQMQSDAKPLVLTEFGLDSLREGEAAQAEMLGWQIRSAFAAGLAGAVVFCFTDDWWRGGAPVLDWAMGLTDRQRKPKPAFAAVREAFQGEPLPPLSRYPKVSVIVACYNGERTLKACLDSLQTLNYPDYEIILVDDGSTDNTAQIAAGYPAVRCVRQPNLGLSAARNAGIAAARGEIVAFTDADCRADEDWLHYLVSDLLRGDFIGMGGPNLLPPEDSLVAAAVMASPGGPAHVMLTDRVAEHIPGCNMAFFKWALEEIGGFDPVFRRAGDDVDICWRLQQAGHQIGFSPSGFVWHYRRSTVKAYLRQQQGYGEAEALLVRKHPEYFNSLGGSVWSGRIYSPAGLGLVTKRPVIYHGLFGSGLFQTLYTPAPATLLMLLTSFEYHVLVTLPLLVLSAPFPVFWPVAATSVLISLAICAAAAYQADLPRHMRTYWSKPLIALLYFLQPIWRGWARYRGRLNYHPTPASAHESLKSMVLKDRGEPLGEAHYWMERRLDRLEFVRDLLARLDAGGWQSKSDNGWSGWDVEIFGSRWCNVRLTTVAELHPQGRQLLRCRLSPTWSMPARVAFGAALALELLAIGLAGPYFPWIWLVLLSLPIIAWFFSQEQRNLQRLLMVVLDDLAESRGWHKLKFSADRLPAPTRPRPEPLRPQS